MVNIENKIKLINMEDENFYVDSFFPIVFEISSEDVKILVKEEVGVNFPKVYFPKR